MAGPGQGGVWCACSDGRCNWLRLQIKILKENDEVIVLKAISTSLIYKRLRKMLQDVSSVSSLRCNQSPVVLLNECAHILLESIKANFSTWRRMRSRTRTRTLSTAWMARIAAVGSGSKCHNYFLHCFATCSLALTLRICGIIEAI